MNKNVTRKFILSVSALAVTAMCFSSTTYAWFAKNANAWTEDYEIKLHTDEGLSISVDGIHWYDSISKDQLTNAIALYRYNTLNKDNPIEYADLTDTIVSTYSSTSLAPVSPDENFNFWGYNVSEEYTPSADGLYHPTNLTEAGIMGYYVSFDLYFKAIPSSSDAKDKYNLVFASEGLAENMGPSYIQAENSNITLNNTLYVPTSKDTRSNPTTPGKLESGEVITINPADAMRIAVTGAEETLTYEINEGYGSYALNNIPDGAIDDSVKDLYDPAQNPMYTYFNNTHNLGKLSIPEYDASYVNTKKDFESLENLGTFTRDSDGNYNDVKITVYIWLDGYDADYLEGVNTESVHFFLNFTKVEG
jgi:hypothetical protein